MENNIDYEDARDALMSLLWELPMEFSREPGTVNDRNEFKVIKERNVRKVHAALWELQKYFGVNEWVDDVDI